MLPIILLTNEDIFLWAASYAMLEGPLRFFCHAVCLSVWMDGLMDGWMYEYIYVCGLLVNQKGKPRVESNDHFSETWYVGSAMHKC